MLVAALTVLRCAATEYWLTLFLLHVVVDQYGGLDNYMLRNKPHRLGQGYAQELREKLR